MDDFNMRNEEVFMNANCHTKRDAKNDVVCRIEY